MVNALVVGGEGLHNAQAAAQALRMAKFETSVSHLNDLVGYSLDELCKKYGVLVFPGGFSYGDCLGAGKVLALKIRYALRWNLSLFASRGGLVLGIGNGFQALVHMHLLGADVSITHNLQGYFLNAWMKVVPSGGKCLWLKGLGTMELPICHQQGRLMIASSRRAESLRKMEEAGMTCLKYESNPNGSEEALAGLCDPSGRIFGMMPHPELFVRWTSHPEWTTQMTRASSPGQGLVIFENAYREAVQAL